MSLEEPNSTTAYIETRPTTFGRNVALYLSKWNWYFPKTDESNGKGRPSLEEGWSFFEHVTLFRYISSENHCKRRAALGDTYQIAKSGETNKKTHLYPLFVPEDQLSDLGVGIGLYFASLRYLSIILLVAFLINMPLILNYASESYSLKQITVSNIAYKGSAMCTNQVWKPCPTCEKDDWSKFPENKARFATSVDKDLRFIKKNLCEIQREKSLYNYAAMIFVCLAFLFVRFKLLRKERHYDEIQQTASDYSIVVSNPPGDARDPEEWKLFFGQFGGQVRVVTIHLDNGKLLRKLVKRRELLLKFELMLPVGVEMDISKLEDLVQVIPPKKRLNRLFKKFCSSAESIFKEIKKLDVVISELSQLEYSVDEIFVTFESEDTQRKVLKHLSTSTFDTLTQRRESLPEQYRFRGEHVLNVFQPAEPSSMRWSDLNASTFDEIMRRLITILISIALIIGCGGIIYLCEKSQKRDILSGMITLPSLMIMIFNGVTPEIAKYLSTFEFHRNLESYQWSLYLKICLFRWTNTAIIISIIVPFTSTLTDGNDGILANALALFINEMVYIPVIRLMDLKGQFYRHYLAPRAPDQRRMNLYFCGSIYDLAERYTDMSKVMFLTLYYGTIFPMGFLFGAIALIVNYCVDKYCLLRCWYRSPPVGPMLSRITTTYVFPSLIMTYSIITAFSWSGFPYDNACEVSCASSDDLKEYIGFHTIKTIKGGLENATIDPEDCVYKFCNQDFHRKIYDNDVRAFPPIASEQAEGYRWMNSNQETISLYFGWTAVAILGISFLSLSIIFLDRVKHFFQKHKNFEEKRRSGITLSDLELTDIYVYVPQMHSPAFPRPLLACDVHDLPSDLIGWDGSLGYDVLVDDIIPPDDIISPDGEGVCESEEKAHLDSVDESHQQSFLLNITSRLRIDKTERAQKKKKKNHSAYWKKNALFNSFFGSVPIIEKSVKDSAFGSVKYWPKEE